MKENDILEVEVGEKLNIPPIPHTLEVRVIVRVWVGEGEDTNYLSLVLYSPEPQLEGFSSPTWRL